MSDRFTHVNGYGLTGCALHAGNLGPWFADCDFEEAPELPSGPVTLTIGALTAVGTVQPSSDGTFGLQRKCRIVGGAGGWSRQVSPRSYSSDAGVKVRDVVDDLAREVGETIGTFLPASERLGAAYARCAVDRSLTAATTLEDVIGGVPWWVGFDGLTHVGPRPAAPLDSSAYELLAFDARHQVATLAVDDPSRVTIGRVLEDPRLSGAVTVRAIELQVSGAAGRRELRIKAWCSSAPSGRSKLAGLLESIAQRSTDQRLFGKWRYRVIRMRAERVELQALSRASGLPDMVSVHMAPGAAGWHAELTPGAEVLVEFVEGDRSQPVISGFAGKNGQGHVPASVTVMGGSLPAARQGEIVMCGGLGTVACFAPVPPAAGGPLATGVPYLISFAPSFVPEQAPLYGSILTGQPLFKLP
jgi:hypothetical protein